jgi:hypothetical protein
MLRRSIVLSDVQRDRQHRGGKSGVDGSVDKGKSRCLIGGTNPACVLKKAWLKVREGISGPETIRFEKRSNHGSVSESWH